MINCIEQESLQIRRSIYGLSDTPMVSDRCLIDTVKSCLKHCPSPFNAQTARIAVLFADKHHLFWQTVWENMQPLLAPEKYAAAKQRLDGFAAAYGTILFFIDNHALAELKKQYPLYKKNMHDWVMQENGILQYMIWQTLAENEEGASLQHYNELISKQINKLFKLPNSWKLVAQMPWGSIIKNPPEKSFLPLDLLIRVLK